MTIVPLSDRRPDAWARTAASQVADLLQLVAVPPAAAASVPDAPKHQPPLQQASCGCWVAGLQIHYACAEHAS